MSALRFSPGRVGLIARITLLEAVRQKLFNFLAVIAVAVVISAQFLRELNFGSSELKFILDFGFGALAFFGSILAVVGAAQLFFGEIENRTALTVLARPVFRSEFILGKFVGISVVLLAFVTLVVVVLIAVLWWRERELMVRLPEDFPAGPLVPYGGLLWYGLLQWLKLGVVVAITIFIASYSQTNLYAVAMSFLVLVVCHLQYLARDAWQHAEGLLARLGAGFVGLLFPNFQLFNLGDRLVGGNAVSAGTVLGVGAYALVYIAVILGLAVFSFRRREI